MNFEEWYAKLGEWLEENTALNMSYAAQRHLARHLEEWESSRPTPLAPDGVEVCAKCDQPAYHHDPSCFVRIKPPRK